MLPSRIVFSHFVLHVEHFVNAKHKFIHPNHHITFLMSFKAKPTYFYAQLWCISHTFLFMLLFISYGFYFIFFSLFQIFQFFSLIRNVEIDLTRWKSEQHANGVLQFIYVVFDVIVFSEKHFHRNFKFPGVILWEHTMVELFGVPKWAERLKFLFFFFFYFWMMCICVFWPLKKI